MARRWLFEAKTEPSSRQTTWRCSEDGDRFKQKLVRVRENTVLASVTVAESGEQGQVVSKIGDAFVVALDTHNDEGGQCRIERRLFDESELVFGKCCSVVIVRTVSLLSWYLFCRMARHHQRRRSASDRN